MPSPVASEPIRHPGGQGSETIWTNRDFLVMWIGQGISELGTAMTQMAVPLLVVAKTGSGLQMGVLGALQSLPAALFGLFAGVVADRWSRRWIMFWSDLARAVLLASVVALPALLGIPSLPVLYVVIVPLSLLNVAFFAAYASSIPSLVGYSQIATATAAMQGASAASYILGPSLAAIGIAALGPEKLLGFDAVSFAISAASLALMRRPLQAGPRERATGALASLWNGLAFIRSSGTLLPLTVFRATASVLQTMLLPVAAFAVAVDRGLPAATFGFMISAYSLGSLIGFAVSPWLAHRRLGAALLVSHATAGVAILATAGSTHLPSLLACVFAVGSCDAIVLHLSATLRQRVTPDRLLGRVISAGAALCDAMLPVGMLLSGILMQAFGGVTTLFALGTAMAANAGFFAFSVPLRRAGREPGPDA